jgi:Fe-S-cluster-containing hydrogenase component 2
MNIVRNGKACYGCRACELVCAYHHSRVFAPEGGSIKVYKDHLTGEISWTIDLTCDFCAGENQPLCIRYCTYEALIILKEEK